MASVPSRRERPRAAVRPARGRPASQRLKALEAAAQTWREKGVAIDVDATFVENDPTTFAELTRFLKALQGHVQTTAHAGEFGDLVPQLRSWLADDAGLIFVDPTGWKGARHGASPSAVNPDVLAAPPLCLVAFIARRRRPRSRFGDASPSSVSVGAGVRQRASKAPSGASRRRRCRALRRIASCVSEFETRETDTVCAAPL